MKPPTDRVEEPQNRSESAIRAEVERILAEATAADAAEVAQPTLGGELPDDLARPGSRLARLRAALGEIEAERDARRAAEQAKAARMNQEAEAGRRPRGRTPADPAAALAKAEADAAAAKARCEMATTTLSKLQATSVLHRAEQRLGAARNAAESAPAPEPQANTTDPESRLLKGASGWAQGFNAQAAVNGSQVVVAVSVTKEHNDVHQLVAMMDAVAASAAAAGITEQVGTRVDPVLPRRGCVAQAVQLSSEPVGKRRQRPKTFAHGTFFISPLPPERLARATRGSTEGP